ncbi:hypothetical protein OG292_16600 [Streptomyces sp. NBC_01511]|uniref:hypothetical protein n=1 Tax=Streptomyces sp. NBC_01511 TaxID=2903889 RepID=UPI0038689988
MSAFRYPRDCGATRKDYQPYTLIDTLLDADADADADAGEDLGSGRAVSVSSLEISLLGFQARSSGKTGLAALKAMRLEHPILVHGVYTYLIVMALVLALTTATAVRG